MTRQTVRVELCGKLADIAPAAITIDVPAGGMTARELLAAAGAAHPLLSGERIKVCVNEVVVDGNFAIGPGDTVALFPPVSGG